MSNYIQCAMVAAALKTISDAASKLEDGSKGQNALNAVTKCYGAAGTNNGVNVGFSNTGFATETLVAGTNISIALNLGAFHAAFSQPGINEKVETAGGLAHEGQHGMDDRSRGRDAKSRSEYLQTERRAFRVQSYVNQGERVA